MAVREEVQGFRILRITCSYHLYEVIVPVRLYGVTNQKKWNMVCLENTAIQNACWSGITSKLIPAGTYMFKVISRNTRKRCEICSKLTIQTPERSVGITVFSEYTNLFFVFVGFPRLNHFRVSEIFRIKQFFNLYTC